MGSSLWRVSPATWDLVRALERRIRPSILSQLGGSGEPGVLPEILPHVFDNRPRVARAAIEAVVKLFDALPPSAYGALDQRIREGYRRFERVGFDPRAIEAFPDERPALLCLLSCVSDGHVREWAVRAMSHETLDRELPFLIIRTNDWVAQVREAAISALSAYLTPEHGDTLVRNLAYIEHAASYRRAPGAVGLAKRILALLATAPFAPALRKGLAGGTGAIARSSLALAWENPDVPTAEAVDAATAHPDPFVRLRLAELLADAPGDAEFDRAVSILTADRFAPVRRQALRLILRHSPGRAEDACRKLLFDPSARVRLLAQFSARTDHGIDIAQAYLDALETGAPETTEGALLGLADLGVRPDPAMAAPYLKDPRARLRAAAIHALSPDPDAISVRRLVTLLRDPSPRVSREAANALGARQSEVSIPDLWAVYDLDRRRHVLRNVIRAIDAATFWSKIPYLIEAACDDDAAVRDFAGPRLQRAWWRFERSNLKPTETQVAALSAALVAAEDRSPGSEQVSLLRNALGRASPP